MTVLDARTNGPPCGDRSLQPGDEFHLQALAHAVVVAAQQVDEKMLAPVGGPDDNPAFEPRTLLAILTFCYARQIYGSAEVAARLRREENLRLLCAEEAPDATTLRRFRVQNRLALNFCLKAALRFLGEEKVAQGLLTRVSEGRLAEEASRRIIMAMFTDSLELDKEQARGGTVEFCLSVANARAPGH